MALYIPDNYISVDEIIRARSADNERLATKLRRARQATEQIGFRFSAPWEDPVTMAAQAAVNLIAKGRISLDDLRYIAVGTETSIDHSKPIASYLQGALQNYGIAIPRNLLTFQVQHACASGTIACLNVAAQLRTATREKKQGIVICSDIARYAAFSSAELTQGAGAIAMLVEPAPLLFTLDIDTAGYASEDVDDFFRPLYSPTPIVRGDYSVKCYHVAMESAFLDHCQQTGNSPEETLLGVDIFALHVPFRKMARAALNNLLRKYCKFSRVLADQFIQDKGVFEALDCNAKVGNIYSGSLYLMLMTLLEERARILGEKIIGKRILLFSYGSGNAMIVIGGTISPRFFEAINNFSLDETINQYTESSVDEYEQWLRSDLGHSYQCDVPPKNSFYLAKVTSEGYREYGYNR